MFQPHQFGNERFCPLSAAELKNDFFSGLQYAQSKKGTAIDYFYTGYTAQIRENEISASTRFDLASLTKALFTAPACYLAFDQHILSPSDSVLSFFPSLKKEISLFQLLSHQSGYPAHFLFYEAISLQSEKRERKEKIIEIIAAQPNTSPVYSDLNYIILGFILEKVFDMSIGEIWRYFCEKTDVDSSLVFTARPLSASICAATSFSKWRGRICHGEVEDDNCFLLGSEAGHAGLFGSAHAVVFYLSQIMEKPFFNKWFTDLNGAGFDKPSPSNSNYGKYASMSFRGHLGFTGTAFLLDMDNKRSAALLTNRTHIDPSKPEWQGRIRAIRQEWFDTFFNREDL